MNVDKQQTGNLPQMVSQRRKQTHRGRLKSKAFKKTLRKTHSSESSKSRKKRKRSAKSAESSHPVDTIQQEPFSTGSGEFSAVSKTTKLATTSEKSVATTDLLQQYFREIRKYPLLSKEEEYGLAVKFTKTQDPSLAYRLVTANLRLVVKIAKEYQSGMANPLDLIQEGNIGLMHAVKKFDPFRGIRLSSYSQWWIRAYILKYIVNNARIVKVGTTQAQRKLFFNLRKEREKLIAQGFKPEPSLIASRLNVHEHEVVEMQQRLDRSDLSLDAPVGAEQKSKVGDLIASGDQDVEEQVVEQEFRAQIRKHMKDFAKTLKGRQRVIWKKRLISDEPETLQKLGAEFGVTRERARQLEKEITNRFREFLQKRMPDLDAKDLLN